MGRLLAGFFGGVEPVNPSCNPSVYSYKSLYLITSSSSFYSLSFWVESGAKLDIWISSHGTNRQELGSLSVSVCQSVSLSVYLSVCLSHHFSLWERWLYCMLNQISNIVTYKENLQSTLHTTGQQVSFFGCLGFWTGWKLGASLFSFTVLINYGKFHYEQERD